MAWVYNSRNTFKRRYDEAISAPEEDLGNGHNEEMSVAQVQPAAAEPDIDIENIAALEEVADETNMVKTTPDNDIDWENHPGKDMNKILANFREKLTESHKTEQALKKRVGKLEEANKLTQSELNAVLKIWNRLDEDVNIFKERIHSRYYMWASDMVNDLQLGTISTRVSEDQFMNMAQNSKQMISHVFDGIQGRLKRLEAVAAALKSEDECVQFIEIIIQKECATMQENMYAFRRFREKYKSLETKYNFRKVRAESESEDKANTSDKLKETIDATKWNITKLLYYRASLNTRTQELQETYKHIVDSQKFGNRITQHDGKSDADNNYLLELHDLRRAEQEALAELQQLKLKGNDPQKPDILESLTYKQLQKNAGVVENIVTKQFEELVLLLSQTFAKRNDMVRWSYEAEGKELDKQSKSRKVILDLGKQIETVKEYLREKRLELQLNEIRAEFLKPVYQERYKFLQTLQTHSRVLHAELEHLKNTHDQLWTDRWKLMTVDKEMNNRIHDFKSSNSENFHQNSSSGTSELMQLKSQLRKAEQERGELKFTVNAFKSVADTRQKPIEELFKSTQNEIRHVQASIRKIKQISALEGTVNSLNREFRRRESAVENLNTMLESSGQAYDMLVEQHKHLMSKVGLVDTMCFQHHSVSTFQECNKDQNEVDNNDMSSAIHAKEELGNVLNELKVKSDGLVEKIDQYQDKVKTLQEELAQSIVSGVKTRQIISANRIQTDYYCQAKLDEIMSTLKTKTEALAAEDLIQTGLRKEIQKIKQAIDTLQYAACTDELTLEQVRQYKEILMCSICQVNIKDVIIPKCEHIFCNTCLNHLEHCPNCRIPISQKDVKRLYLV